MRANYQKPVVDIVNFSAEEILTDMISVSATGTDFSSMRWDDFIIEN